MKRSAIALGLALALALAGCARSGKRASIGSRALTQLFGSARKVPNRIERPVRVDARLAVLWVGHATVLVQMDDKLILTDPVFTDTVGQLSRRLVEPGLAPEHVPRVDAAVVSHMHFDHFSFGSIDLLEDKIGRLVVPLGALPYVPDWRFPVSDLDRWQTVDVDGLRITAVPVRHNGWRYVVDQGWMNTSYTGYVLEYHGLRVYFGGDTGYEPALFRETRLRCGPIDLALLPIAPVEPRDFMRKMHVDPIEALLASDDLGARYMVPMHYETFVDTTSDPGDARKMLRAALDADAKRGRDRRDRVFDLRIGEQKVLVKR